MIVAAGWQKPRGISAPESQTKASASSLSFRQVFRGNELCWFEGSDWKLGPSCCEATEEWRSGLLEILFPSPAIIRQLITDNMSCKCLDHKFFSFWGIWNGFFSSQEVLWVEIPWRLTPPKAALCRPYNSEKWQKHHMHCFLGSLRGRLTPPMLLPMRSAKVAVSYARLWRVLIASRRPKPGGVEGPGRDLWKTFLVLQETYPPAQTIGPLLKWGRDQGRRKETWLFLCNCASLFDFRYDLSVPLCCHNCVYFVFLNWVVKRIGGTVAPPKKESHIIF